MRRCAFLVSVGLVTPLSEAFQPFLSQGASLQRLRKALLSQQRTDAPRLNAETDDKTEEEETAAFQSAAIKKAFEAPAPQPGDLDYRPNIGTDRSIKDLSDISFPIPDDIDPFEDCPPGMVPVWMPDKNDPYGQAQALTNRRDEGDYRGEPYGPVDPSEMPNDKAGISGPFGFWDPLEFRCKAYGGPNRGTFRTWKECEVKHGRVAMLATVGFLAQELFHPFFPKLDCLSIDTANEIIFGRGFDKWPFALLSVFVVACEYGTLQDAWQFDEYPEPGQVISQIREDRVVGDYGFDPLGLGGKNDDNMRTKELNNGRLAMIAWVGMTVQQLIFREPILKNLLPSS
uniref:Uncharacterized protein n=1 Tax=Chromera velia CCMP2878 TaxID=1169474 RepID=A0A0G4HQW9_9ALVE|eukprot:Cvel_8002.t1-p1 / transcript=Cvel_8002.t1 / gene=Cvel_8002 / organism=Chromera_velia_CCMP2878 / gene_product=Fucoxanthin-chlorophyll a-c binding protein,, putative / transcript_product=Fucoxanthin-chlorophyll a-c binding protein,, putative / location=Cvel_scaffold431:37948-40651(+) / protein_length=342 / sequence_SO=supercontig / SO=protein_coding / is_pseudo=false